MSATAHKKDLSVVGGSITAGLASLMMVLQLACPLLKIIYQNPNFLQPDGSEITSHHSKDHLPVQHDVAGCRRCLRVFLVCRVLDGLELLELLLGGSGEQVRVRDQNLREELPYRRLHLQRRDRRRRWQRLRRGRGGCPDHAAQPSGSALPPPEALRIASRQGSASAIKSPLPNHFYAQTT